MPRRARGEIVGLPFHVVTRGNARRRVFFDTDDYCRFEQLMDEALARTAIRLLAYCLMPNHVHFVAWPVAAGDLARWMHWLLTVHARRHHLRYGTMGHIWQDRYKTFPIKCDEHLLTVLRYVERNALAAGLVDRAEKWSWSSLAARSSFDGSRRLSPSPVPLGPLWVETVNRPLTELERTKLRESVDRGRPFGSDPWIVDTARSFGLTSTLRSPGRPARL